MYHIYSLKISFFTLAFRPKGSKIYYQLDFIIHENIPSHKSTQRKTKHRFDSYHLLYHKLLFLKRLHKN